MGRHAQHCSVVKIVPGVQVGSSYLKNKHVVCFVPLGVFREAWNREGSGYFVMIVQKTVLSFCVFFFFYNYFRNKSILESDVGVFFRSAVHRYIH